MHAYRETAMREKLLVNYYLKSFADSGYDYVTAADTGVFDESVDDELANIRHSMKDVEQQISKLSIEDVMRDYFEWLEESRPTWRRVTFLCYAVGIATLSVPTIHTFLLVAISLAEKLVGR